MPFSGGTFSVYTPGNPVVTGTTISSVTYNATLADFASGLSQTLLRDGSVSVAGNWTVSGNGTYGGTLGVTGAVTFSSYMSAVQPRVTMGSTTPTRTTTGVFTTYVVSSKAGDITFDAAAGTITINVAGTYMVTLCASLTATSGQAVEANVRINGSTSTMNPYVSLSPNGATTVNVGSAAPLVLAVNDVLDVYFVVTGGGSGSIRHFYAVKVA